MNEHTGLLILIGSEKAFDSLKWKFIDKCLDILTFRPSINKRRKTWYDDITSDVLVN